MKVINSPPKKSLHQQKKSDFSAALSALLVTPPRAFRFRLECSMSSHRQLLEGASVMMVKILPLLFPFTYSPSLFIFFH